MPWLPRWLPLLPAGWDGYGAEDSTGMPYLPSDRTFASVLAGVDEVAFTTYVPGMVFGYTYFDVAVDNISISAVPQFDASGRFRGFRGITKDVTPNTLRHTFAVEAARKYRIDDDIPVMLIDEATDADDAEHALRPRRRCHGR